jgi:hypothetical protein
MENGNLKMQNDRVKMKNKECSFRKGRGYSKEKNIDIPLCS